MVIQTNTYPISVMNSQATSTLSGNCSNLSEIPGIKNAVKNLSELGEY